MLQEDIVRFYVELFARLLVVVAPAVLAQQVDRRRSQILTDNEVSDGAWHGATTIFPLESRNRIQIPSDHPRGTQGDA